MPGAVVSLPRFNSNDRTVTREASPYFSCPPSLVSVRVLSRRFIVRYGEIISPLRNVSEIEGKVAIKSSLLPGLTIEIASGNVLRVSSIGA